MHQMRGMKHADNGLGYELAHLDPLRSLSCRLEKRVSKNENEDSRAGMKLWWLPWGGCPDASWCSDRRVTANNTGVTRDAPERMGWRVILE